MSGKSAFAITKYVGVTITIRLNKTGLVILTGGEIRVEQCIICSFAEKVLSFRTYCFRLYSLGPCVLFIKVDVMLELFRSCNFIRGSRCLAIEREEKATSAENIKVSFMHQIYSGVVGGGR